MTADFKANSIFFLPSATNETANFHDFHYLYNWYLNQDFSDPCVPARISSSTQPTTAETAWDCHRRPGTVGRWSRSSLPMRSVLSPSPAPVSVTISTPSPPGCRTFRLRLQRPQLYQSHTRCMLMRLGVRDGR